MSNTTSASSGRNITVTLLRNGVAVGDPVVALDPVEARRTINVPLDAVTWEVRDSGASPDEVTLRGHAAVFNSLSEDLGGFREIIEPGFFRSALRKSPDVRLLFNHDPNHVMARTASGTLELREDQRGLHVFARVDKSIGWVQDLRTSMQRGDIDQMSFAFTIRENGDDWAVADDGVVIRTLRADGADDLFDASVVTYPAYKSTEVSMRSVLEDAIAQGRLEAPSDVAPGIAAGTEDGVERGVEEGVASTTPDPENRDAEPEADEATDGAEESAPMPVADLKAVSRQRAQEAREKYLRLLKEIRK